MTQPLSDYQLERSAQELAEKHLTACEEAMYADEDTGEQVESPAVGPFCGCTTCVVREVLHAAWPTLLELARREVKGVDGPLGNL